MHDIWNPWHGCRRISPGCDNCYMYYMDHSRDQDGSRIYRTNNFNYPLQRDASGSYRVRAGELIRVCMTSDFFLEEADEWREEAWDIMYRRPDVSFYLLTKRAERISAHLPADWGDGWDNIWLNVTCENQEMADKRLPVLERIPAKHKGVMCAPLIGKITLEPYISKGFIEQVICGGENYGGSRPCDFDWVKGLYEECRSHNVPFSFIETGTHFIKDKKHYTLKSKKLQSEQAYRAGLNYGEKPAFALRDPLGFPLPKEDMYCPVFDGPNCGHCGSCRICNGCSHCGKCS